MQIRYTIRSGKRCACVTGRSAFLGIKTGADATGRTNSSAGWVEKRTGLRVSWILRSLKQAPTVALSMTNSPALQSPCTLPEHSIACVMQVKDPKYSSVVLNERLSEIAYISLSSIACAVASLSHAGPTPKPDTHAYGVS